MGKLAMVGNCAKEVLKKNKAFLCVTGSALGIGTLGIIVINTLEKIEKTKIDYFYKGYRSGFDAALETLTTVYANPGKDVDTIVKETQEKHTPQEFKHK